MTDDLDDFLKEAMAKATPAPDPEKRAANLRLAEENFDRLQGSTDHARLTSDHESESLLGRMKSMFATLSTKGGLAATTGLVAVGLLVLTPQGRDLITDTGPIVQTSGEATETAANEETEALTGAAREQVADAATAPQAPQPTAPSVVAEPAEAPAALDGIVSPLEDRAFAESEAPLAGAPAPAVVVEQGRDAAIVPESDTEAFANADANPVQVVAESPFSTFSIDVDTASYAIVRNSIERGQMPPAQAVRIEEMINYFPYDYAGPEDGEAPFRATYSLFETPWNADTQLLQIAIQGEMPAVEDRPPLNLVFLIDSSGSMNDVSKLPLLRQSFQLMLDELRPGDQVAIVAYAGSSGLVLEPTDATDRDAIVNALFELQAGGSTAGQEGLEQAYAVAGEMAADGEVTRVILATDGDFNVGLSDPSALEQFIADQAESGTYLSVLGFGRGNLDDATMQALAQSGNGNASYIDTLQEARKVLVDELTGALFPIADDVKIQMVFNPEEIAEYRLIGYETRALNREDFNNDAVDAGEIGAGASVTAIYEITPVGSPARLTDPSPFTQPAEVSEEFDGVFGILRLRYKAPGADDSTLIETPIVPGTDDGGQDARFAAAIAGFGQLLRGDDQFLGDWGWDEAIQLATENRGTDAFGYRMEAVNLMRLARSLDR